MGELLIWWLLLEALGALALPLAAWMFSASSGRGYAFTKVIGLLGVSYLAWLLGHAGMPYGRALWVGCAVFAGANLALAVARRAELAAWLREGGWRQILVADGWWTAAFLFFAWQRSLHPHIVDQEKYMDFAFFNTLLRTETMPPEDPWMSGLPFNYYYFGYLICANLARLLPIASPVAYNLCVATLGGLVLAQLCAIGWKLTRRHTLALFTGALGVVLGNLDGLLQVLEKGALQPMDYFRSTRIVGRDATINEFPFFTVIHGDLHPHFLVMPVTILLLGWLLDASRWRSPTSGGFATMSDLLRFLVLCWVFGAMVAISPWELPVGAMVTFLLLQQELPLRPLFAWPRVRTVLMTLSAVALGYLYFLPFYWHFHAPQGGVGVKLATTAMSEFLTVFGGLLLFPALYLGTRTGRRLQFGPYWQLVLALLGFSLAVGLLAGKAVALLMGALALAAVFVAYAEEQAETRAPVLLILAASVALLACEVVYIKDPYGERLYRMNTVFKLYLQSWFLLAVASPWCLGRLLSEAWTPLRVRRLVPVAAGLLLVATVCYPLGVTATRLSYRAERATLDGNAYLRREHADDFAAIEWLRRNVQDLPVILEATGNPYSYYARFSSNTGLPTVMGWANHEGLWRSHDPTVEARKQEVIRIYAAPTLAEVEPLLRKYRVRYIVVGELERKDFRREALEKFDSLPVAFRSGQTTVYHYSQ